MSKPTRDKPWLFRTYAGHSTAAKSNELYRTNLARGQTGLSVAFDLPTQTGYDSDHPLAKGEVGKVGVPISHLGDMRALFDGIPLERMNTSMTINAPAAWLLVALYRDRPTSRASTRQARGHDAERHHQGISRRAAPTSSRPSRAAADHRHDRLHLPRGAEVEPDERLLLPPAGSRARRRCRSWPSRLATAIAVLDAVRARGQVPEADFPKVVGRI